MDRMKSAGISEARDFFSNELKAVMERHRVSAERASVDYLTNLMIRYMESSNFFAKDTEGKLQNNVLADLYAEYVHGDMEKKRVALQRLGDICLLISGFFAESLQRKVVDIGYYFGMGGSAYHQLSHMQFNGGTKALYSELATKFKPFSNVLGEMSERSGLQTNSDLLRLYERWLFTGSERLRSLLSDHGIPSPLKVDVKTRH